MIQHAEAVNARLLKVFPKGFVPSFWERPTIHTSRSCSAMSYVHTADLDKVYDAVGKVLADEKAAGWSSRVN